MKKLITKIIAFAMLSSFAVLPEAASADYSQTFKYENDFSTADSVGNTGGNWDMANVGQWVTVKYNNTDPIDNWSHDTTVAGPSGTADGVLRLGDGARPAFFFNAPVTDGNIHVGFDVCFEALGETRSTGRCLSHFGFLQKYTGDLKDAVNDKVTVSDPNNSSFPNALIKALYLDGSTGWTKPVYQLGGLGNVGYSSATDLELNKWMRVDVVMPSVDSTETTADYNVKYYINGQLAYSRARTATIGLQPLYGFVMQTNANFDNEAILVDNLVIESYTGDKEITATADKTKLGDGENSVTFTFSDSTGTVGLSKADITVTKDFESYSDFTFTKTSNTSITIGGLDADGVYNVTLPAGVFKSAQTYLITKGKLSQFLYKQDFSNSDVSAWNDADVGSWLNSSGVSFAYDSGTGADGAPGVMKLANTARPVFLFNKPITDGTIYLSYKIKLEKSTANYGYYYSGLANEEIMNGASVTGDSITLLPGDGDVRTKMIDTFMASGLSTDNPSLAPGSIGTNQPGSGSTNVSFSDWHKVDVVITINPDGTYLAVYYLDNEMKSAPQASALMNPYCAFIMNPFNMGTSSVYIDDLVIEHSYYSAVISDADLSVPGKVKVTVPDTSANTTSVRKLIVAGFNSGRFKDAAVGDFRLGRTDRNMEFDFDTTGCDEIKVFLLNSLADIKPLANAYSKSID